jgi:hypothetical protein
VLGTLKNPEQSAQSFNQTFLLYPQQPKGFFVLNDIFQYLDEDLQTLNSAEFIAELEQSSLHNNAPSESNVTVNANSETTASQNELQPESEPTEEATLVSTAPTPVSTPEHTSPTEETQPEPAASVHPSSSTVGSQPDGPAESRPSNINISPESESELTPAKPTTGTFSYAAALTKRGSAATTAKPNAVAVSPTNANTNLTPPSAGTPQVPALVSQAKESQSQVQPQVEGSNQFEGSNVVCVKNFSNTTKQETLKSVFGEYGEVRAVRFISSSSANIEFASPVSASKLLAATPEVNQY